MAPVTLALSVLAILLGAYGNGCVLWLLWRKPCLRDQETFLHVKLALLGFLMLGGGGGYDIAVYANSTPTSSLVCFVGKVIHTTLAFLITISLLVLMASRCLSTGRPRKRTLILITVGEILFCFGVFAAVVIVRRGRTGTDCDGSTTKFVPILLIVINTILVIAIMVSQIVIYLRAYRRIVLPLGEERRRLHFFLLRYRKSLVTCCVLVGLMTAPRFSLGVVRLLELTGGPLSPQTLALLHSLVLLSNALNPYMVMLLTLRVRPSFLAVLPWAWCRRRVMPVSAPSISGINLHPCATSKSTHRVNCVVPRDAISRI